MSEIAVFSDKELNAFRYGFVRDLWVITSYYNPCGYKTRRFNHEIFAHAIRESGLSLLTVECAFGTHPFDLQESIDVIRVRSRSSIWQKERLLNLAISWLPPSCKYVVWLDCDLLFLNKSWPKDTVELLEKFPLVQVFETCNRLPPENLKRQDKGDICRSFASITSDDHQTLFSGNFEKHGHTGYGWAARYDILRRRGLYEHAIIGSADHFMAHAAFGDLEGACMKLMTDKDINQIQHFQDWGQPFFEEIMGKIGAVPGQILHLWHGDLKNRKYLIRNRELTQLGFNPYTDIIAYPGKPLEWKENMPKDNLKVMFENYFKNREEDYSLFATS